MIISLCGGKKETGNMIKELEKIYDVVIFDYFKVRFQMVIEYQKVYYDLLDSLSKKEIPKKVPKDFMTEVIKSIKEKRAEFSTYIDKKVFDKINEFLNNNKDKIVIFVSNNLLLNDIYRQVELKILVISENNNLVFNDNKNDFDYIINSNEKIDVKKLVKL